MPGAFSSSIPSLSWLLCLGTILLSVLGSTAAAAGGKEYGIMIDAGSTGSRIYLYQWPSRESHSADPPFTIPVTQEGWSEQVSPGLSDFVEDPEAAGPSMKKLLDFALETFRSLNADPSKIPIFLGATAGLRVVKREDQDAIIQSVRDYFHSREFLFEDEWAKIISGEEEGVFGWLTVNYLLGNLPDIPKSVGALDLGGASTQISFSPESPILSNYFPMSLNNKVTRLYTHSFLRYGLDQAGARVDFAVAEKDRKQPCLPEGRTREIEMPDGSKVLLEGVSDAENCADYITELLEKEAFCKTGPDSCSVNGVYQPPLGEHTFYAFSAFAKVLNSLRLPGNSTTLSELQNTATVVCNMNYDELDEKYGPSKYLDTLCFGGMYSYLLLAEGYGFPESETQIRFADKIDNVETGWALGAILFEANLLPFRLNLPEESSSCGPFANSVDGVIVALLVIALAAAVIYIMFQRRKFKLTQSTDSGLLIYDYSQVEA